MGDQKRGYDFRIDEFDCDHLFIRMEGNKELEYANDNDPLIL